MESAKIIIKMLYEAFYITDLMTATFQIFYINSRIQGTFCLCEILAEVNLKLEC